MRQRWSTAKDAGLPFVTLEALVPLSVLGRPAAVAVWIVESPGQQPLRLPLAVFRDGQLAESAVIGRLLSGGLVGDSFAAEAFVRAWVRLILGQDATCRGAGVPGTPVGAVTRG
jgi:hypothetical protein